MGGNMKVLYVGHIKENSGWSQASIDLILALDSVGVDVVPRTIKLNNANPVLPKRILELEAKSSRGCDVNIQHILPHMMDYNGRFKKNIAMFIAETYNLFYTWWPARLNLMDEIWVPNTDMLNITCPNSGITKPVHLVPHATDISKYSKEYPKFQFPEGMDYRYKFYFIGENVRRKHLMTALIAYYTNFTRNDNVVFVIKTNRSGQHPAQCMNDVMGQIKELKKAMGMYKDENQYPPECVITEFLSEEQLYSIHQQCDTFLMPSFGEAWSIPAFDAMGFGKEVVSSACGGMKDFLRGYNKSHSRRGHLINGSFEPVVAHEQMFENMHNSFDTWYNISISEFGKCMRNCYDSMSIYSSLDNPNNVNNYSYETVGNRMKELINA